MPKPKLLSCRKALKIFNQRILEFFSRVLITGIIICFFTNTLSAQNDNWETRFLRNIETHRTAGKTSFFKGVSGSTYIFIIGTPAAYLVTGLIRHDKNLRKDALYITESIVAAQIISFSAKAIIKRDRPAINDPTLVALTNANSPSFPSGHTTAAFSIATSLSIIHPKWYVIVPSYTWASLVGYSRLYLGVHYPSDILAGALLGSGTAWFSYRLNKWMDKSKKNHLKEVPQL